MENLIPSSHVVLTLQICNWLATSEPIIFTIIVTMSRVGDLTIESIIRKYEHRQQALRSDLDAQDTARPRGDLPLGSGASTPEFSFTIGRNEINRKLEDQERIQRTQKKQEGRMREEEGSFSTDRETILRQLEQTEERLARSQRNFVEASRKCEQLQRREKQMELNGRLKGRTSEQFESKIAALQRENSNYRECVASKDTNITVLREKLKEKNERLIDCERIASEMKSQLAASKAAGQQAMDQEQEREREKESLVERLRNELITLQKIAGDRDSERKELLAEIEKSYRSHQEELEVIRKSYVQVEEEYQQWIDNCNAEKLALIKEYQQKLTEARSTITPNKPLTAFEDELQRRERESTRLIALTARQSSDLKQLRSDLQAAERMKSDLIHKVSSLENSLIDKTEAFSSLQAAYSSLSQQLKEEEERTCDLRQRYNGVNRQFVELRGKCGVLFESLEAAKREGQGEGAELVRVRKELLLCREQLQRSRGNEMTLSAKLADATRAVKDKLAKSQQQREENLTQLMAERLQNARLRQQLQETKQYLKREYDLSLENTRKELEHQITAGSKTTRSNIDPEKQQLYLQLRALQRKYELLAHQIVTVDEVMDIANKVKRRHEPSKKALHS